MSFMTEDKDEELQCQCTQLMQSYDKDVQAMYVYAEQYSDSKLQRRNDIREDRDWFMSK